MTWKVKPGATTPAMEQAADLTKSPLGATGYVEPNVAVEEAVKTAIPSGVSGQPDVYNTPEEIAEIEARLEANKAGEIFKPDPVTKAVETATGGTEGFGNKKTATQMFSELGDLTPEQEEQNDFDLVDVIKQLQVEQGLRNEDGTPKTSMIGANISSDLGPLGTSGVSMMEDEPITLDSGESPTSPGITSESIMQYLGEVGPLVEGMDVNGDGIVDNLDMQYQLQIEQGLRNPDGTINEAAADTTTTAVDKAVEAANGGQGVATGYSGDGFEDQLEKEPSNVDVVKAIIDSIGTMATEESEIDKAVAAAVAAAEGDKTVVEKELAKSDPVQAAVDAAVGNGQPTTDDTILDTATTDTTGTDTTGTDTTETTGTTETDTGTDTQQPDFMTQLQELIAQMQAEQTAAAEQAAAAEAERQKQAAAMTQNYMVGQPAVGYNPYQSGQYQSDPYGAAGVPDMGGITSIPVPAAYTPNPYLIGGMT